MSAIEKAKANLHPQEQPKVTPADIIGQAIEQQKQEIQRALPTGMDSDRFARIALTTMKQNPRLIECHPRSIVASLMLCAQLGLEPGPLQHCYLVPYKDRDSGVMEAQFQIGYRGILRLARESGYLKDLAVRTVYVDDEFDWAYGTDPYIRHKPAESQVKNEARTVRCYYGVAEFRPDGRYFEVVPPSEIERHRQRSKAPNSPAWRNDYEAMAHKTVVRIMEPFLPLSVKLIAALSYDGTTPGEITPDMADDAPGYEEAEVISDTDDGFTDDDRLRQMGEA